MRRLAVAIVVVLSACHASPAPGSAGPPTCARVADHVETLMPQTDDHHAHKVRDVMERRCRDDHWALDVTRCMLDERDLHAGHHCQDQLTAEQRTAFTREVAAIDAPPPIPTARRAGREHWPAECLDYADQIELLAACDKLPAEARDAMRQSFEQTSDAWSTLPPEALASLAEACKAGADAVRQSTSTICQP